MSYRLIFGYCVLAAIALAFLVIAVLVIRVMTLDTPSPPARKSNLTSYLVKEGDSFAAISQETGVPIEEIESLNPALDPLALVPGRRIRLKKASPRERRRAAQQRARRPRVYVVKPGDGALAIAEKTKVDPNRLRALNPKTNLDKLTPGMRLRLRRR